MAGSKKKKKKKKKQSRFNTVKEKITRYYDRIIRQASPGRLLILGYFLLIIAGLGLLSLPFAQKEHVGFLDNLFISASALSTTGFVTVGVASHYNFIGQLIVLLLIQLGGMGYMTVASFIMLAREKPISKMSVKILNDEFNLPENFNIVHFIKETVYFSAAIELAGAVALYIIFQVKGISHPVWSAVFHSISAFSTAGFSLFPGSFVQFSNNLALNLVIALLSIAGGLGFIVFTEIYDRITRHKKDFSFTTRIILRVTLIMLVAGTLIFFLSVEDLKKLSVGERLLVSFFQSMTALTTVGFNTYPVASIPHAPLFLMTIFMLIGASPSGTGGGIKSTTVTALFAEMKSIVSGRKKAALFGNSFPEHRMRLAVASFFFYMTILVTGIYLLLMTEQGKSTFDVIFEGTSALGTVGLSRGITSSLSSAGKIIIMLMMFLGRIGPLSFGIAFMSSEKNKNKFEKEEDVAV